MTRTNHSTDAGNPLHCADFLIGKLGRLAGVVGAVAIVLTMSACSDDSLLNPSAKNDASIFDTSAAAGDSRGTRDGYQLPTGEWGIERDADATSDSSRDDDIHLRRARRVLRAFVGDGPEIATDVLNQQLQRLPVGERVPHVRAVAKELGRRCVVGSPVLPAWQIAQNNRFELVADRAVALVGTTGLEFGPAFELAAEQLEVDLPEHLDLEVLTTTFEDWIEQGIQIPLFDDVSMFDEQILQAQLELIFEIINMMVNGIGLGEATVIGAGTGAAWGAYTPFPGGAAAGAVGGAATGAAGWFIGELWDETKAGTRDDDGDGIQNRFDDDMDGDGIPNDEDDDMDGDGTPNDEDSRPKNKRKSITAESEAGWYFISQATQFLQYQNFQDYMMVTQPFMLEIYSRIW